MTTKRKAKLKLVGSEDKPEPNAAPTMAKKHKLSLEQRVERLEKVVHASAPLPDYD